MKKMLQKFSLILLNVVAYSMFYGNASGQIVPRVVLPTHLGSISDELLNCADDEKKEIIYVPLPSFITPNYTIYSINTENNSVVVSAIPTPWPVLNNAVGAPTQDLDYAKIRTLLPNIMASVSIEKSAADVSVNALLMKSEDKFHNEKITIDFMKFRTEPVYYNSDPGKVQFIGRVGAGLRLVVHVKTNELNLSGSVSGIAASVQKGNTSGYVEANVIGIDANDLTIAMPFTTDLSDAGIQKIIEAMAIVKSKMYDQNTKLTPEFMAKLICREKPKRHTRSFWVGESDSENSPGNRAVP